jgi:hypothetical protein
MMITFKKRLQQGCHKIYPTQKYRPAKGMNNRVNIQIIKDTDITYTSMHTYIRTYLYIIKQINTCIFIQRG